MKIQLLVRLKNAKINNYLMYIAVLITKTRQKRRKNGMNRFKTRIEFFKYYVNFQQLSFFIEGTLV